MFEMNEKHDFYFFLFILTYANNKKTGLLKLSNSISHAINFYTLSQTFLVISHFCSSRTVSHSRNAAQMFADTRAAWLPATWTFRARKVQWGCPKGSPVTNSCAPNRVRSVKSGTDSQCASAGTVVDESPISPVPRMA